METSAIAVAVQVGIGLGTIAFLVPRVNRNERRLDSLPKDYIPRAELQIALKAIEKLTAETSRMLRAYIYSGGNHKRAIEMLQAAADTSYLDAYIPSCETFEGCVSHFYLDTVGKVTVGVGDMVPDVLAAAALPLLDPSGAPASRVAIIADFLRVQKMERGHLPGYYSVTGALGLSRASIEQLLRLRLEEFDAQLHQVFPGFDAWPTPAKLGAIDMIYNLGESHLTEGFPHFVSAGRAGSFEGMAANCGRDVSLPAFAARNAWTRRQFLLASGGA